MTTQQEKYAQMQSKLQEGLKILSQAANDDGYQLGMALLKLHAALEDQFRIEIAEKAPSLRMEVEDPKKTSWNELIRYGKQYLGLSESDARAIVEANRQRQSVAHGGNYEKRRSDLMKYASFVERWCDGGRHSAYEFRPRTVPALSKPYQPPPLPSSGTRNSSRKPWYRSALFLTLIFFLAPPLWSLSIITDRYRGCLMKAIAGAWLAVQLLVCTVLLNPDSSLIRDTLQLIDQQLSVPLPFVIPSATPGAAATQVVSPVLDLVTLTPLSSSEASCTLVWVEGSSEMLAGKNRAMVWAEVVLPRVNGSGMTARQFYNLVLEQNPDLVRDGYEFKAGKTYLRPECE